MSSAAKLPETDGDLKWQKLSMTRALAWRLRPWAMKLQNSSKQTCRLAVTGKPAGPSLSHLLEVLGKEKVLVRIEQALATIG
jgi:glutamyl/glutaminyl-tRNA synthetase